VVCRIKDEGKRRAADTLAEAIGAYKRARPDAARGGDRERRVSFDLQPPDGGPWRELFQ
jgi:hypothetical protein